MSVIIIITGLCLCQWQKNTNVSKDGGTLIHIIIEYLLLDLFQNLHIKIRRRHLHICLHNFLFKIELDLSDLSVPINVSHWKYANGRI